MIQKHGKPITGAKPAMTPRPPVLSDAADTSRDAQKMVSRPPMPFENPYGTKNVPAPVNPAYRSTGSPKELVNNGSNRHSIHNGTETTEDMLAAVGEPRTPKGYNSIISGFPTSAPRKVGSGNFPTAKRRK